MTITLSLTPSVLSIRPYSVINPSVGEVTIQVDGTSIYGGMYPHQVYLEVSGITNPNWAGTVELIGAGSPPGIVPPYASLLRIMAGSSCPYGTYYLQVVARPTNPDAEYANDMDARGLTINVTAEPTRRLTVEATVGGTTSPAPGNYTVYESEVFNIVAIVPLLGPGSSNILLRWERDDGAGYYAVPGNDVNPDLISVTNFIGNTKIRAVFQIRYKVTMLNPVNGTVSPSPGIFYVNQGTPVELVATPALDYMLDHWVINGVNLGNSSNWQYTPSLDSVIQALFKQIPVGQCLLDLSVTGNGRTVPVAGSRTYLSGTSVTIKAYPNGTSKFLYWTVNDVEGGTVPSLTVIMDRNQKVRAVFTSAPTPDNRLIIATVVLTGAALAAIAITRSKRRRSEAVS